MITSTAINKNFMKPNLSFSDRQLRFVTGASMIAATLIVSPESIGMLWSVMLLASIPFITMAITGWDPLYAIAGKTAYVEGEEDIQQRSWTSTNLGAIDRVVRLGAGAVLIATLMTMNTMQSDLIITLFAIPLIVTAIIAWDPFYALMNINSFASRVDVETAEPDTSEQTLGTFYVFPESEFDSTSYRRAA